MAPPARHRLLCAATLAAVLLAPRAAGATPTFPATLQAAVGTPATPACSLCHVGPQRRGTVTTPFGRSMRARGLVPHDEASLRRAVAALEAEGRDSDGDGTPDIEELRAGADPNRSGTAAQGDAPPELTYGCGAAGGDGTLLLGSVLLGLALGARRRRARDAGGGGCTRA